MPNAKREVRKLAMAFAAWLYLRRWTGIVTDSAHVKGCYRDDFNPDLDQYEVWRVEWTQVMYAGANAWADTSAPLAAGDQVMAGYAPNIGAGNAPDYTQVFALPGAPSDPQL